MARAWRFLNLFGFLSLLPVAGSTAQERKVGDIVGIVIDAATGAPLVGARVTITPHPLGVVPPATGGTGQAAIGRTVITDGEGSYRFAGLVEGTFQLHVQRIGYRAATIGIDLDGRQRLRLSVELTVAPVRLEPVAAVVDPPDLYSFPAASDSGAWDGASRERWRQATFLESDVRVLSSPEVEEAVTLGEGDVLRALQRLPGVATRDDWTAEPWVRGAPGDHTRVRFDGLPLFNPSHAGGLLSSVNAEALGGVFLFTGARPPGFAEGGAGLVDLRSRPAGGDWSARATVSSALIGVAADRRWDDGRVGTLVSVRRSWWQRTRRLRSQDGLTPEIPNDFADGIARIDADLGGGATLVASAFWQRDWIDGFLDGGPANNRSAWGTGAARASLLVPLGSGELTQNVGVSRFTSRIRQLEPRAPLAAFDSLPTQEPTDNDLTYFTLNGAWTQPAGDRLGPRWRVGYELSSVQLSYRGAPPNPYSIQTYLYTADFAQRVVTSSIWAEKWWSPVSDVLIRTGARWTVDNYGGDQFTPHLSLRYQVDDRLSFSAATGSHYQYVQSLARSGIPFGPSLGISPIWVLADGSTRPMTTDITTFGGEYWLSDDWLISLTHYDRASDGIVIPDPTPGTTDDDVFLVQARNDATGVEVNLRRLSGRTTAAVSYSYGVSTYRAGREFPSPADRRHVVDATVATWLPHPVAGGTLRAGAAWNLASGTPYTRVHPGWYDCSEYVPGGYCEPIVANAVEEPNAERGPWSTGFDLHAEWSRRFGSWQVSGLLEVQNLLNTPRGGTYVVDQAACRRRTVDQPYCGRAQDTFVPGLARRYELGLRVAF